MRLVALSSAFVFSFAFISASQPAVATPAKKDSAGRQAAIVAKKSATAAPSAKASSSGVAPAKVVTSRSTAPSKTPQVMQAANGKSVQAGKAASRVETAKALKTSGATVAPAKRATGTKADSAVKSAVRRAETAKRSRGAAALASVPQVQTYPDRFGTNDTTGSIPANFPSPVAANFPKSASAGNAPAFRLPHLFASPDPVMEARRWIGTNPTDRSTLWCARFMNFVLERSGFKGTGSDAAKSFASYGHRVPGPRVGAIAVMTRGKYGGHVGIVSGIDEHGNPIVISGNNYGRKVGESTYPRSRIYAYVMPER
jgi:uncharacterized protein (TIGR02594 family)